MFRPMSPGAETFDVVVVGVSDALRGSEGVVAEDLAEICRLPSADIKLALNQGELYVHRGIGAAQAEREALTLRGLGAKVETRVSEDSIEMPIIEPDPDEVPAGFDLPTPGLDIDAPGMDAPPPPRAPVPGLSSLGLGGAAGDSSALAAQIAPPPEFGGARRQEPVAKQTPRRPGSDPSRPQGRTPVKTERPFRAKEEDARTSRFEAVQARTIRGRPRPPAATEIQDLDAPTSRYEPVPTERRRGGRTIRHAGAPRPSPRAPAPAPAAEPPSALDSLVANLEAAASGTAPMGVVTLDGLSNAAAEAAEAPGGAAPPTGSAEPEAQLVEEPVVKAPAVAPRASFGPAAEASLSLDAAGTMAAASGTAPVASGSMTGAASASVAGGAAASSASGGVSGTYAASSGSFAGAAAFGRAPQEVRQARNLFVSDPVANYLIGVTIGLVLGVIAALALRGSSRDAIDTLEVEVAAAYVRPVAVASGELRPVAEIERDLDDAYGGSRKTFLFEMFLIGVPLGLAAGRIRLG